MFWVTMALGSTACSERPGAGDGASIPLASRTLVSDIPFGEITDLVATDERLYVIDAFTAPGLYVLDRISGEALYTFGAKGEGPGEFRVPISVVDLGSTGEAVWVFDAATQRVTRVTEDMLKGADAVPPQTTQLTGARATFLRAQGTGRWLASGDAGAGRLQVFSSDGAAGGVIGTIPGNTDELATSILQKIHPAVFRPRSDGSLAVASRRAGRLEILEPSGELRTLAAVPVPFEPVYQLSDDDEPLRAVLNSRSRAGYSAVAVSDDRIYALFSGRTVEEMTTRRLHLGNTLHEFDWDGHLLNVWALDREASQIALSPNGTEIYAAAVEPAPAIVIYQLKR